MNTTTVVAPAGFQYITNPSQNEGGIFVQGGNPQQMQATPLIVQGASQTVNTTPMMATQGANPPTNNSITNEQVFPVRTFKVFGGVQIGIGVLLCILSIIGAVLGGVDMKLTRDCGNHFSGHYYPCYRRYDKHHILFTFDLTCLVLSGWFILTGFLPMCMSRKRKNSWSCLKKSFMVCSIIGASVFVPTVFSLGVVGSILRHYNFETTRTTVISAFIAVLSFAEVVVAIVSASYCCCCTKWDTTHHDQQGYIFLGGQHPQLILVPQPQIPVTNMQPAVMTGGRQQYEVSQQNIQNPSSGNTPNAESTNVVMNPPPYKA